MDSITYKKSQTGWILLGILPIVMLYIFLSYYYQWGDQPLSYEYMLIFIGVFGFILLIFYNLTIYIQGKTIHVKFGIGLIHIKIPIEKLHEAKMVKTPWWYGWGIRVTPQGMLYNVYGRDAVKVNYTGKGKTKTVLLGSAEPEELLKHIKQIQN
ncbi:hypothetical protein [Parvicella tangerina]|uniref:Uncharacterized protein n=1 Tax=Parvicella tangerina TaxID=2829795 RepID=A0A916JND6_9FLAO|nr:hypothetical protein [Parvicella tangerina]CAG5082596.1 hypothetical protein CRYO30217_01960 [Parvicella tangerina]